jgi:transmembrane sensor
VNEAREIPAELLEQAADWFLRVRAARADSEVHGAWLNWIEADPAHRAAFAEIQQTWDIVGHVESPPWPRAEELAIHSRPASQRVGSGRLAWFALAASVVAGAAALLLTRFDVAPNWLANIARPHDRIATGRGEQQSAILPDGSRIELGGLTGVQLKFTPELRLVVADEGEVFYKVERDPTRPFIVQAGPVQVTAVGTAFSVRRESGAVSVVVTEGVVEVNAASAAYVSSMDVVKPVRVNAGERVRFDRGQLEPTARPVHAEPSAAWRRGQLRFQEEPLRVVVASLNRYTTRQIVVGDPALEDLRFTGTVFDDSVEDWLKGVQVVFPVAVNESDPDRVIIVPRPE